MLIRPTLRTIAAGLVLAAFATNVQAQEAPPGPITLFPAGEAAKPAPAVEEVPAKATDAKPAAAAPTSANLPSSFPATVRVTGTSVRLRSDSNLQSHVVKVLTVGDLLRATGSKDGWICVQLPVDAPCWISASFVADLGNGNGMVRGNRVNLRISPNTTHYPVGQVSNKAVRLVLDESGKPRRIGDWIQIIPPTEATAWIHGEFIELAPDQPKPESPTVAVPAAGATNPAPAGEDAPVVEVTPEQAAAERALRLAEEARAFRELDKLFLEELAKPAEKRDFAEMKLLYNQYAEAAEDAAIRSRATERARLIEETERKITGMIEDTERRAKEAREAAEKAEAERIARIEAERQRMSGSRPAEAVSWLSTGFVADHGKDARIPASHALCDADGKVIYYIRWDTGDLDTLWQKSVRIAGTAREVAGWDKPVVVITRIEAVTE